MHYSGPPPRDVRVPAPITALAGDRPMSPVWLNELGGLTFQLGSGDDRLFAKWDPKGSGADLEVEATRLRWAGRYTPVSQVLDLGADEDGTWMITRGLPGESAVSPRWKADPRTAVRALGTALRALHERLPVDDCPFSWSVDHRLDVARRAGAEVPADLPAPPPIGRLVVCHGDPCAPNTLLNPDGTWSGHVDMGALGLADRWADLAVATWSTEWNYGPGWDDTLLDGYGISPDPERIDFYRRLWAAT
ncbi:aminoglycoside 3'-phosphotransferase [Streptomyces milbemycinicus]|uniref:aminoglycoside 3'-phosphotransferase n=1 Tax=Streptomyces milbemycinicus TaxID=476552 RepID=UPI0033CA95E7